LTGYNPEERASTESAISKYIPYRGDGMKFYVGEYIYKRLQDILEDPTLLTTNRILTSDVYYDLRKPLKEEAGIDLSSGDITLQQRRRHKIQNKYVLDICRDLGIRRRHAGIITGDTGYLYFRGKRYAVSLDELDRLKTKGIAVVIIEKQGTSEKLSYKADSYGIALLSTRGFLTENALDLSELAQINGAKNVSLTDDDIAGQIIASNTPYKRIGIDFETLDYFGIRHKIDELAEAYTPNSRQIKHIENNRDKYRTLTDKDFEFLKKKRIEIHAVLNEVGVDRFWDWILAELEGPWNYNRAIKLPKPYMFRSSNIWRITQLYDNRVAKIIAPLTEDKRAELSNYKYFIKNVKYHESRIKGNFQTMINEDTTTDIDEFNKDLDSFVKKYDNGEYEEYEYEEEED
jgi:hypothetical protein